MVEYLTKRGLLSKLNAVKSNVRNGLYNGLAARQLIAHHVSANAQFPTPDALRTKFLNNLQAVGNYPTLCRKVAIIDGVSNGILNPDHLTNNESLIHIINKRKGWKSIWGLCNANICKNVDWEAKGAPATGSARVMDMWTLNPIINLIFWVPPFETTKSASAAWGNSSQENAPGGRFSSIFGNQGGNVNQSKLAFDLTELFYLITGSKRTTFTQNINRFTFIPSYSSADLRFPTMTDNSGKNLYMDWSKTYLCGHTPFDYVYAPTDANNEHVAVTQQISEWFESEVRCNRADLPVLFTPLISGSSTLCTVQNYSLSFCQAGSHSITWVSSNPTLATVSGSGDQISLTPHGSGSVTLTATINYPCLYSKPIVITKSNIAVGAPAIPNIYALQAGGTCYYDAAVTLSAPATTVEFSFNSTTWFAGIQNGDVFRSGNAEFLGPMYQMVYARTSNVCGKGPVFSRNLYIPKPPQPCAYVAYRTSVAKDSSNVSKISMDAINESAFNSSNIRVYPNPADKKLIIELPVLSGNTQVNIYNNEGRLMLSQKLYNKTSKVDISDFKAGIYLIRVQSDDGKVSTVKIVKE